MSLAGAAAVTLLGVGAAIAWRAAARSAAESPGQRAYTAARRDVPRLYAAGCFLAYRDVRSPDCVFGDSTSDTTVVLFGDSHAAEWFPALEPIARVEHWRLVALTKAGCPAADVRIHDPRLMRDYAECDEWREASLRRIAALRPARVFVASASEFVQHGSAVAPNRVSDAAFTDGTRKTLARLVAAGLAVTLLADNPASPVDPLVCLSQLSWIGRTRPGACAFPLRVAIDSVVAGEVVRVAASLGVGIVDLADAICPAGACVPERDGVLLYRDGTHLTASYAAKLAPALAERLAAAGIIPSRHAPLTSDAGRH